VAFDIIADLFDDLSPIVTKSFFATLGDYRLDPSGLHTYTLCPKKHVF